MDQKVYPLKCRIQASAKAGVTRVDIYDDIGGGDGFFSMPGISASDFAAQISGVRGELEVHINSAGGDVFDGIAIQNAISGYKGEVTTIVDGLAASIASVIAQAGRRRIMRAGSMMMIHDAFGGCVGNAAELQSMAATLDKISDNLASIYATRSKKGTPKSWRESMRGETWYTAEEAVVSGLADGIDEISAQLPDGMPIAAFTHVPDRIAARLTLLDKTPRVRDKALPVHHTDTVDTTWDGGAAEKNCPAKASSLRAIHAWEDTSDTSEGADDKKGNYRFPHHATPGGPANLNGVRNGLARLSGSKIPDSDKPGVEAHLRAHLKDGGGGDENNELDYFVTNWSKKAIRAREQALSILATPTLEADSNTFDVRKVMAKGERAEDPEAFFRNVCAGRKAGDPKDVDSWCLPYKTSPTAKPNVHAILSALARLSTEPGLTNREQARVMLTDLMNRIDPKFSEKSEDIDSSLLAALFTEGLKGA